MAAPGIRQNQWQLSLKRHNGEGVKGNVSVVSAKFANYRRNGLYLKSFEKRRHQPSKFMACIGAAAAYQL